MVADTEATGEWSVPSAQHCFIMSGSNMGTLVCKDRPQHAPAVIEKSFSLISISFATAHCVQCLRQLLYGLTAT